VRNESNEKKGITKQALDCNYSQGQPGNWIGGGEVVGVGEDSSDEFPKDALRGLCKPGQ